MTHRSASARGWGIMAPLGLGLASTEQLCPAHVSLSCACGILTLWSTKEFLVAPILYLVGVEVIWCCSCGLHLNLLRWHTRQGLHPSQPRHCRYDTYLEAQCELCTPLPSGHQLVKHGSEWNPVFPGGVCSLGTSVHCEPVYKHAQSNKLSLSQS